MKVLIAVTQEIIPYLNDPFLIRLLLLFLHLLLLMSYTCLCKMNVDSLDIVESGISLP